MQNAISAAGKQRAEHMCSMCFSAAFFSSALSVRKKPLTDSAKLSSNVRFRINELKLEKHSGKNRSPSTMYSLFKFNGPKLCFHGDLICDVYQIHLIEPQNKLYKKKTPKSFTGTFEY